MYISAVQRNLFPTCAEVFDVPSISEILHGRKLCVFVDKTRNWTHRNVSCM
jgi:hypothetical protein